MIIVHVTVGFGGGVGTVIKNLINYQLQQGNKIGISYPENAQEECEKFSRNFPHEILFFPKNIKQSKGSIIRGLPIKETYKQLKKEFPNDKIIFHAHNPVALGLLNNINNIPLVCTIHGVNTNSSFLSQIATKMIIKRSIRKRIKVIGVSEKTSSYYNNILKIDTIKTIVNGVKVRTKPTINKFEKFTIGFVAYVDDLKGWRCLFEAYNSLEDEYKNQINLIFAGLGNPKDIFMLQNLIKINNLEDHVQYLGQVDNAGDVLTPKLDLVVLPSRSEGIPMTLLEAIGNGVPVLATKVGGISEVLVNGKNGYFINRDYLEIAEYIREIYDDKDRYHNLKLNCIEIYNNKFTIEKMGDNYLNLYSN